MSLEKNDSTPYVFVLPGWESALKCKKTSEEVSLVSLGRVSLWNLDYVEGFCRMEGLLQIFTMSRLFLRFYTWTYRRTVLGNEIEEREKGQDFRVLTVGQDGDEGHDVVLDRVAIDRIDLRQNSGQRIVAGNHGVNDRLESRLYNLK